ncbi:MAG: hypothetical protein WBB85_23225, partial [Albidovulum sp.]|uniref:hypothetical protein n=1 Tax=Albidovulum sp. TaxID=1872424 RepID=UPI003C80E47B
MEQMILRALLVVLTWLWVMPIAAEDMATIRTYSATLTLPPEAAAARLNADLGGLMEVREEGGVRYIDYAGLDTPEPLRRFLGL